MPLLTGSLEGTLPLHYAAKFSNCNRQVFHCLAYIPNAPAKLSADGNILLLCLLHLLSGSAVFALLQDGKLHLNSTHLVRSGITTLLEKRGIWETELMEPAIQAAAPLCTQLQMDGTLRTMLGMHLPSLRLKSQIVKLQYNGGM